MEVKLFGDAYRGRRILLTGHTGFKGSWLARWLHKLGAEVTGLSLDPATSPNHWDLLELDIDDRRVDIRDFPGVLDAFESSRPEIVFHLAAQPLVRRSYRAPLETWSTNVLGTAHVLEAARLTTGVRAIVIVTTDKVYENREWPWGYRETDRLGGHDPYSASKAASELVSSSYRDAFFNVDTPVLLATARAGNVIGGGDWSEDRLLPDLVRAVSGQETLEIRSPDATRPWQHVLDCLSGYLLVGEQLLNGHEESARGWNFGPDPDSNRSVRNVLSDMQTVWPDLNWKITTTPQPHEAQLLYLDSAAARSCLHWRPIWDLQESVYATAAWYRTYLADGRVITQQQIDDYIMKASQVECAWAVA